MTSAAFSGFLTPSPLVCTLDQFIVLNSRNLPYYICFWGAPLPLPLQTSYVHAPYSLPHNFISGQEGRKWSWS